MTPRLHIILSRISRASVARDLAKRWRNARERDPALVTDLIRLGGVMLPAGPPPDAQRAAYEAGRRDAIIELLALMQVSPDELNFLAQQQE